jgi:hypothetical protein
VPTVLSYAQPGLNPRTLILGVRAFGAARAFPYDLVLKQKLVRDYLGGQAILILVGPDGQSVRAFRATPPGSAIETDFYRMQDNGALMMDAASGSRWNFQGCAVEGKANGTCLDRLDVIKDYWFDWRHYNRGTSVGPSLRAQGQ